MEIRDPLDASPLDWTYKGLPFDLCGVTLAELAAKRRPLFSPDAAFPVAVLLDSAIAHNSSWMRRFLQATGASIAPHGKTTMAPALFHQQIADGAWGISAATMHHVRAYRRFGVSRVLFANQICNPADLRWLRNELLVDPNFEFYSLVDSTANVDLLRTGDSPRRHKLLIEIGAKGARTGVRSVADGLALARYISAGGPNVQLVGVECFEGVTQMALDARARAEQMIGDTVELARRCDEERLFQEELLLTAGGSSFFDIAARELASVHLSRQPHVVIRSGCYLSHDDGMYAQLVAQLEERDPSARGLGPGLRSALQIWARVQSRPEPSRVICAFGKRDVGSDAGTPIAVAWLRASQTTPEVPPEALRVVGLNDQHAFIDCPTDSPIQVGDLLGFGVSHPCTTFDKWRLLLRVSDEYMITGAIRTYF
jgi:D-serine dehydratase